MGNVFKTGLLLAVLTCLVVLIGQALGGQQGMIMAFGLALVMNFVSYWFSDKMVLAMYRAQPVDEAQAPQLYGIVRNLVTRAGIPMPKVYIIPTDAPNAFATGRNPEHAAIAVTEGLLRILDRDQLEGVIAWLNYGSSTLSYMYGGRSLWLDDDLIQSELSLFDRRFRVMFVQWQTDYTLAAGANTSFGNLVNAGAVARYADATLDLPLPSGFHSALEYALRFGASPSHAAMWRVDWLRRDLGPLQLHAGYQFRWYRHAFGPRDFELPPTVAFSFPYQEDAYVTNPYEYLGISHDFDQWSHTLMLESRLRLPFDFELFANEELWQRQASLFSRPILATVTPEGFQAPGDRLSGYYSAGVSYYPWRGSPQRADAYLTNKQVSGTNEASDTTFQRFKPGRYYVIRFKAYF